MVVNGTLLEVICRVIRALRCKGGHFFYECLIKGSSILELTIRLVDMYSKALFLSCCLYEEHDPEM